jgi:hypothetical protein
MIVSTVIVIVFFTSYLPAGSIQHLHDPAFLLCRKSAVSGKFHRLVGDPSMSFAQRAYLTPGQFAVADAVPDPLALFRDPPIDIPNGGRVFTEVIASTAILRDFPTVVDAVVEPVPGMLAAIAQQGQTIAVSQRGAGRTGSEHADGDEDFANLVHDAFSCFHKSGLCRPW